jgi:hypothetical protein
MPLYQLTLLGLPLMLITAWLVWLTRAYQRAVRVALGGAWVALVWLTFGAGAAAPPEAAMVLGRPESDELWTFGLQSPDQRIERHQPVGDFAADASLVLRYVWVDGIRTGAPPTVEARVNGQPLTPASTAPDPEEYWCCALRWRVPADLVTRARVAHIEVWMPERDPRVRFIAQRNAGAARLGSEGSLFFDGTHRVIGVPHTHSGSIRSGFVHIWLEPAS